MKFFVRHLVIFYANMYLNVPFERETVLISNDIWQHKVNFSLEFILLKNEKTDWTT